jgi:hypothetical protein
VWHQCGRRAGFVPQISVDANRHQFSRQGAPRLWCASRSIVVPRLRGGAESRLAAPPPPSPTPNQLNCLHARKPHWKTPYGALWRAMSGWIGKRSCVPVLRSYERDSVLMRMEQKPRPASAAGLRPDQSIPSSAILSRPGAEHSGRRSRRFKSCHPDH